MGERKIFLIVMAVFSIALGIVRDWAKVAPIKRVDTQRAAPKIRPERFELKKSGVRVMGVDIIKIKIVNKAEGEKSFGMSIASLGL